MLLFPADSWAIANIWIEARGEPQVGRIAVGEVMINRMKAQYMCDGSLTSAILSPYQFSGWNTKDHNRILAARLDDSDPLVAACSNAWATAKQGSDFAQGALLYVNPDDPVVKANPPLWISNSKFLIQIGKHHFYAPK